MEPAIAGHEAVDHNELPVHTWRVPQLTPAWHPGLLAEIHADHLDWRQIARLVQRGCPRREPRQRSRKETADHCDQPDKDRGYSLDGSIACQEKTGTPATCQQMLPAVCSL